MKKVIAAAACIWALGAASHAYAANRAESFVLSPFLGGYTFDGKQHLKTMPVYGVRGGYNFTKTIGVEAVFDYVATESTRGSGNADVYNYRLEGLYHFLPGQKLVPFLAAGAGGITIDEDSGKDSMLAFNYGGGAKYFLKDSIAVRGDIRHLVSNKDRTMHNVEYTAGAAFYFGGVKAAPKTAAPAVPSVNLTAVPGTVNRGQTVTLNWTAQKAGDCTMQPDGEAVPPTGSKSVTPLVTTAYIITCKGDDGSFINSITSVGVIQPLTPSVKLTVTPTTVTKGEKATLAWSSTNASKCDLQPGVGPTQPDGSVAVSPAAPTSYTITCTGDGGTAKSTVDVAILEKICITLDVRFDFDKAIIKPEFHDEIKKVSDFMDKFPTSTAVIEGNTDDIGTAAYNLGLSKRRADAVIDYLVSRLGIAADRLSSKGFGFNNPVASNTTAEGRALNRRTNALIDCVITVNTRQRP